MRRGHLGKAPTRLHTEQRLLFSRQFRTHQQAAIVVEADPAVVEHRVEMWCQQQAIEHVEAFSVALAPGPRLDVRGAQQAFHVHPRHRAATLPVVDQRLAEDALTDALDN